MKEELCDVMEKQRNVRRLAVGLGSLAVVVCAVSAWAGAHEYRKYGDATTAEAHLKSVLSDDVFERAVFYGTLPARQLGYWFAKD